MKIYRTYFGKKLKEARETFDVTQADLAEKVSVEPSTVSKWENGKDFPGEEKVPVIIEALDLPADYFDVNKQTRKSAFNDSAAFLAKYASLSPDLQEIVWAIVFEDEKLYGELPSDLKRALE